MSPFADALRQCRANSGLRQFELADRVGYERSYISGLESDKRPAPGAAFVDKVCQALQLDDAGSAELHRARRQSQRRYLIPGDSPKQAYAVVHELFMRIDRLSLLQLEGLMIILRLGDLPRVSERPVEGRIRRNDRHVRQDQLRKEDAM